jgi:hypothetical protein
MNKKVSKDIVQPVLDFKQTFSLPKALKTLFQRVNKKYV